ncbi:MAG: bifunctional aldolase/short-chain dehydrogenase [Candidatus Omnitrophica bacterium]|nr:bifunctional aldolase/short-chain dehydrogenase [Candidatus Omnitrophota bacterium]
MKSLWNDKEAVKSGPDALALRVYTSRLLGRKPGLVMHGGGNTSVKAEVKDFFGRKQEVIYIKASGWDLATIKSEGFAAVKMDALLAMAAMKQLSDTDMVRGQRAAMLDPYAPNPSVEAILHAIIPYKYVDHSHADAVVTITNTPDGKRRIQEIYGTRVLIVPYVMPGFVLARKVYEVTRGGDWSRYDGMILLNHGLFTFANSAKESYENHIRLVTKAEQYIKKRNIKLASAKPMPDDLVGLARLRRAVSRVQGGAVVALLKDDARSVGFSRLSKVNNLAARGTLTPDHVIRTKSKAVIIHKNVETDVNEYARTYKEYFDRHAGDQLKCLDLAPRWAVWPGHGVVTFGRSPNEAAIVGDIVDHTLPAIQRAEVMGGWKTISENDLFDVEYWELEQAKLSRNPKPKGLIGKVALVTGAASGIGKACKECLQAEGANVVGLDIKSGPDHMQCDVTREAQVRKAVEHTVRRFGGLDIIVSNAGVFPPSMNIESMQPSAWEKSLQLNLTGHQYLIKHAIPYLTYGIDPAIVIIASKNVPAPGPGAAAYSVAKAGLTQLGRVAALELGAKGVRVNMVHPNQVFDTAIWTRDVLEKRARHYGMSVEEYKTSNILHTTITSKDVAQLVCAMAGPAFAKTTGSQIPIDGGNERVI